MNAEVSIVEPYQAAQSSDSRALMSIIERAATSPDFDMDKLQKLFDLKNQWDATEARKAMTQAMAAFKANPPKIIKDKHVGFQTKTGFTEYDHATLGAVCAAIIQGLAAVSISHRWEIAQNENNRIKVTCVLTHAQGHSESVSLHAGADDSGGKNSIQSIGSTITYLQRYSLFAATGLAPEDTPDDDGRGSEDTEVPACITPEQVKEINAGLTEVKANVPAFLQFIGAETVETMPARKYKEAAEAIAERKRSIAKKKEAK